MASTHCALCQQPLVLHGVTAKGLECPTKPRCEYCGVPVPNHDDECRVLAELPEPCAHPAWIPVEWAYDYHNGSNLLCTKTVTTLRCGTCGTEVGR